MNEHNRPAHPYNLQTKHLLFWETLALLELVCLLKHFWGWALMPTILALSKQLDSVSLRQGSLKEARFLVVAEVHSLSRGRALSAFSIAAGRGLSSFRIHFWELYSCKFLWLREPKAFFPVFINSALELFWGLKYIKSVTRNMQWMGKSEVLKVS